LKEDVYLRLNDIPVPMKSTKLAAFPDQTLRFLRALKRNNNREWFQSHKDAFETVVKQPMLDIVESLAVDFARFAPEMVAAPKSSIYRIYRDTRFSSDKRPYKTHAAAVFPRRGLEKHQGAAFYFHLSPAELLIGGGVYMPFPEDLNAIRSHIVEHPDALNDIVAARRFRKMFGALAGEQLSRVPRGFAADHPAAPYLKHKQFLAGRMLPPEEATAPTFYKMLVETFETMLPLVRFLNEPIVRIQRTRTPLLG
jgi:uncharacterized protein (TIGR02453 family)